MNWSYNTPFTVPSAVRDLSCPIDYSWRKWLSPGECPVDPISVKLRWLASHDQFPVDQATTDTGYVFKADLPGVTADQVTVKYEKGALTVSFTRTEDKYDGAVTRERTSYSAMRSFSAPGVDATQITAELVNGVLTVTAPKLASAVPTLVKVK